MTGSKNERSASVSATHQRTLASSAVGHWSPACRVVSCWPVPGRLVPGGLAFPAWLIRLRQWRRTASAHRQASRIVASRNGPAATFCPAICGARDVQAVGWLITGELGWLVTDR
jgi:hypothetical protein